MRLKFKHAHEQAFSQSLRLKEYFIKQSLCHFALSISCREFWIDLIRWQCQMGTWCLLHEITNVCIKGLWPKLYRREGTFMSFSKIARSAFTSVHYLMHSNKASKSAFSDKNLIIWCQLNYHKAHICLATRFSLKKTLNVAITIKGDVIYCITDIFWCTECVLFSLMIYKEVCNAWFVIKIRQ